MFEYLCGKVVSTEPGRVVLEISGVGFKIYVPQSLSQELREKETVRLFVNISLKNEEAKLYGFSSLEDRQLFDKFQNISGIGPSMALNILSAAPLANIYKAIIQEDHALFKRIKGIGEKTAKRIVLELKGTLQREGLPATIAEKQNQHNTHAIAALLSLGYSQEDAWQALSKAKEQLPANASLEEIIRESLRISR